MAKKLTKKFWKSPITNENLRTMLRVEKPDPAEFCTVSSVWRDLFRENEIKNPTMSDVAAWMEGPAK